MLLILLLLGVVWLTGSAFVLYGLWRLGGWPAMAVAIGWFLLSVTADWLRHQRMTQLLLLLVSPRMWTQGAEALAEALSGGIAAPREPTNVDTE